jgi:hypothetical protein
MLVLVAMSALWKGDGATGPIFSVVGPGLLAVVLVIVDRPASAESVGGGCENCGGGPLWRVSVVMWCAV